MTGPGAAIYIPPHCKHCGEPLTQWKDIAAAMESMIENAAPGMKPMLRQAIDEIRDLRNKIQIPTRVNWRWPSKFEYMGEDCDDLLRDAHLYRDSQAKPVDR